MPFEGITTKDRPLRARAQVKDYALVTTGHELIHGLLRADEEISDLGIDISGFNKQWEKTKEELTRQGIKSRLHDIDEHLATNKDYKDNPELWPEERFAFMGSEIGQKGTDFFQEFQKFYMPIFGSSPRAKNQQ